MKFFRYTVLALAFAAGFTACSDDDDYAVGLASSGVYFPTDDALEVELDRNKDAFDVIVARSGETPAATYALTGSADEEVFTLPTSVSFAEGETTTTVAVEYRKDEMGPDKPYKVILAFAEGAKISNYGYESLEMAVTLPAPWKTIGLGTFQDFWVLPFYGIHPEKDPSFVNRWEVELQQHEIDPTRYRWKNPYGENFAKYCAANGIGTLEPGEYDSQNKYSIEFVVNSAGQAVVPYGQLSGATISEDEGMVIVGTLGGYYYSAQGVSIAAIAAQKPEAVSSFDATEDAEMFFTPKGSIVGDFVNDGSGPYIPNYNPGGYIWWSENVDIKDYAVAISYLGTLTTPQEVTYALTQITLGADIASAKAGLVATADLDEAVDAVASDAVATQEIKDETNTQLRFGFEGSGDYSVAVIAYDEEGQEVASEAITFNIVDNSAPKEWVSAGTGTYTDFYCMPMYGMGYDNSWTVAIEQNTEDPTLYRWVHPYGTVFAQYFAASQGKNLAATQYDAENLLYIQFRVVNGNVAVYPSYTGVLFSSSDGYMTVSNRAGYSIQTAGNDWDVVLSAKPDWFGKATLSGDKIATITEPADNGTFEFELVPDGPYGVNNDLGGTQWAAGTAAAAAKAPSLKAAQQSTRAHKVARKLTLAPAFTLSAKPARI
ncbi:MAG: hypothetical protein K2L27_07405 [Muribaculaceae bacterium]|nr:hypothetical protein [Muribaculaceae bacterium]